jgi:protein O-mannosyl-transferase
MNTRRAAVIVMLVTLAALAPTVRHEFTTWDDNYNITDNPHVNPPSADGVRYLWTHEWMHLWVPVTYTAWIAIAAAGYHADAIGADALNPWLFHAANLLIHLGSSLVVLHLLRRLKFTVGAAMFGALIFAIHPVQVEAVAWISGLKDVLSGLLCLVSITCYVQATIRYRYQWWGWYIAALIAFILAMLAKPSAVVLPVVILMIDRLLLERPMKRVLAMIAPMLALAIPFIIIGKLVQPAIAMGHVPIWWRPFIAGDALAFYLRKLIFPVKLGIDYGRSPQWVMQSGVGYFAWIVPIALIIIARARNARASIGVFVAALLPVLGFITFDFQEKSTTADHYLYLAMLGGAIAVASLFERSKPSMQPIFIAVIALLAGRTFFQSRTWADSRTLFAHAVAVNPVSAIAYNNLYAVAMDERNGAEAESYARTMLAIKPNDMLSTTNLAGALAMQERFAEAEPLYRAAAARWPDRVDPHVGLGLVLLDLHRPLEALAEFDAALRIAPGAPNLLQLRDKAEHASTTQP